MIIPEQKIEEIRLAADIVDVVSQFIQLRKRGKNFLGLCPFHSEKTPSFTVSEEKQIYHCFGCHNGGNVFKFLMEYEKISFVEAVQELAKQYGITIEADENLSQKQSEQEVLYDINSISGKYFSDNLLKSEEGIIARKYFEERNIKPQTIRAFGLGYSFPGWDHFVEFAKDKKIDFEKALHLGLIGRTNDGRLFDKFSGRIIFPIFSPNGRVVAFAGRVLDKEAQGAKYLNSPESEIYHKGKILYGLSHAKDEIRKLDKAILVEGYMDLLALYQKGIKNVVAVSGTALTEDQVILLSRYTKNVFLLFDADTAGIKASMRSIELLLKKDFEIKIVSLPAGEDPDSFINKFGQEEFERMLELAENFLEYQTKYYEEQGMLNDPAKQAEAVRELVKLSALITDELKRSLLLRSIAQKFNLREKLIENELNAYLAKNKREVKRLKDRKEDKQEPESHLKQEIKKSNMMVYSLESEVIQLLFEGVKKVTDFILSHVKPEDFIIEVHILLCNVAVDLYQREGELNPGTLISKIEDENILAYVREITMDKHSISRKWDEINPGGEKEKALYKEAKDVIRKFKEAHFDFLIDEEYKKLASGEENEIEILKAIDDLHKEKKIISKELREEVV